jgi:ribose transport system substrate-binding protein
VVETVEAEEEEMEPLTVGYSNGLITHSWRTQMIEDLQLDFSLYKGMGWVDELIIQHAGFDVDLQINQIRNMIGVCDLILINPNSSTALDPVIEEAVDAGVLVITVNQFVTSDACLQLFPNSVQWQSLLAEYVFERLEGEGKVVYLSGFDGQPANTDRDLGFEQTLADYPNIELLTKANGNWDPSTAQQAMADVLAAFPEIDGVVTCDGQCMGVVRAFEAAGREIPVMNGEYKTDFVEYWLANLENGFSSYAVINPPGYDQNLGLGMGLRLLRGWELKEDPFTTDPLHGVDSENVWQYDYTNFITDENVEQLYEEHVNSRGMAEYLDAWPTQEELDALFVQ